MLSIETLIMFILLLGGFIFYARDFKLGLVLHFLMFTVNFIVFWSLNEYYGKDLNTMIPLAFVLLFMVLLAFSLFAVAKNEPQGRFT